MWSWDANRFLNPSKCYVESKKEGWNKCYLKYYLVDKNCETGVSELYAVSDFSVRNDEKVGKAYLLGKYGAVPYIRER